VEKFRSRAVHHCRYFLGEELPWDEVRGQLYWVDVHEGHSSSDGRSHTMDVVHRYISRENVSALAPLVDRTTMESWR